MTLSSCHQPGLSWNTVCTAYSMILMPSKSVMMSQTILYRSVQNEEPKLTCCLHSLTAAVHQVQGQTWAPHDEI